jgi:hypothetical protein
VLLVLLLLGFIACAAIISGGENASVPSETTDDGTGSQEEITAEDTTQGSSSTKRSMPKRDKPSSTAGKSADPYLQFTDGTHQVGKDIQAGTYRTRDSSSGCYFARLNGFSGELDDILANENTDNPAIVTIEPTDRGFESNRCGTWTQDLSPITQSKTSFEDGAYFVGTDIEAGTYRSSGARGCYFARLNGFQGDLENVVANENTDTPVVVTIAPTDAGFESNRCGTWTKIQ